MKYPLELEITDYCWLKCIYCPNKNYKKHFYLNKNVFYKIIDYIYLNKDNILFLDLSWIWDIFLHPNINDFLLYIFHKFKNTWLEVLIPTKWVAVTDKNLEILKRIYKEWLKFNLSIWIYSLIENKHNKMTWIKSFRKTIDFLKKLKNNNLPFSLELLINRNSIKELDYFYKFGEKLWVNYKVHNYHNFWGSIEWDNLEKYNLNTYKLKCSFADDETYELDFYCKYTLPFFSSNWYLYSCSHWGKQERYKTENILYLIDKYPNYLDLLEYVKSKLNKKICDKCTYYKYN